MKTGYFCWKKGVFFLKYRTIFIRGNIISSLIFLYQLGMKIKVSHHLHLNGYLTPSELGNRLQYYLLLPITLRILPRFLHINRQKEINVTFFSMLITLSHQSPRDYCIAFQKLTIEVQRYSINFPYLNFGEKVKSCASVCIRHLEYNNCFREFLERCQPMHVILVL